LHIARAIARRSASACPVSPPPSRFTFISYLFVDLVISRG
jgi:hypothetical protein